MWSKYVPTENLDALRVVQSSLNLNTPTSFLVFFVLARWTRRTAGLWQSLLTCSFFAKVQVSNVIEANMDYANYDNYRFPPMHNALWVGLHFVETLRDTSRLAMVRRRHVDQPALRQQRIIAPLPASKALLSCWARCQVCIPSLNSWKSTRFHQILHVVKFQPPNRKYSSLSHYVGINLWL